MRIWKRYPVYTEYMMPRLMPFIFVKAEKQTAPKDRIEICKVLTPVWKLDEIFKGAPKYLLEDGNSYYAYTDFVVCDINSLKELLPCVALCLLFTICDDRCVEITTAVLLQEYNASNETISYSITNDQACFFQAGNLKVKWNTQKVDNDIFLYTKRDKNLEEFFKRSQCIVNNESIVFNGCTAPLDHKYDKKVLPTDTCIRPPDLEDSEPHEKKAKTADNEELIPAPTSPLKVLVGMLSVLHVAQTNHAYRQSSGKGRLGGIA